MKTVRVPRLPSSHFARHKLIRANFETVAKRIRQFGSIQADGMLSLEDQGHKQWDASSFSSWLWRDAFPGAWVWAEVQDIETELDESGFAVLANPKPGNIPHYLSQSVGMARFTSLVQEAAFDFDFSILRIAKWPTLIDMAEDILLRMPQSAVEMPEQYASIFEDYWFNEFAFLAIARAAHRGQGDDASYMLGRLLDTRRVAHFTEFPRSLGMDQIQPSIFALAQMDSFPVEGLRRARGILEEMFLPPERLEDFQAVFLARLKWEFDLAISPSSYREFHVFPTKPSVIHYIWDGRPEAVWQRLLRPVASRRAEEFIEALAEGDREATHRRLKELEIALASMNLDWRCPSRSWTFAVEERSFDRDSLLAGFNFGLRPALVVLGAAIYHRDRGEWPVSLESLIPEYLTGPIEAYSDSILTRVEATVPPPLTALPNDLREAAREPVFDNPYMAIKDARFNGIKEQCEGFQAQTPIFLITHVDPGRNDRSVTETVHVYAHLPILPSGFPERLAKLLEGLEDTGAQEGLNAE